MLDSLQEMYQDVKLRVRVGGKLGVEFESKRGVKQGDPLSPLLFGLLIDRLEGAMEHLLPEAGVRVGARRLLQLLFADDLALLGAGLEGVGGVQQALALLARCCVCMQLVVNLSKTVGVVFNAQHHKGRAVRWWFDGEAVPMKEAFVYLGMLFKGRKGVKDASERALGLGRRAMFAMSRRCNVLGISRVDLRVCLFDTLVRSIVCFGCEVWGPRGYLTREVAEPVEALHLMFLRMCLGVRRTVATDVLYEEMGRQPLAVYWVAQAVRFRDRVLARKEEDLAKQAMMESASMSVRGVKKCWAAYLEHSMDRCADEGWSRKKGELKGAGPIWRRLLHRGEELREIADDDRTDFKKYTYQKWFCAKPDTSCGVRGRCRFWEVLSVRKEIQLVAGLRMGSHHLEIEEGRMRKLARSQRVCVVCDKRVREDERHVVFECEAYQQIRARAMDIFKGCSVVEGSADKVVAAWMNPEDEERARTFWPKFARFLRECLEKRNTLQDKGIAQA
jgi:hypothetical protein